MTFEIAKKIAYAACELDWLKKSDCQVDALEAEEHINTLHECAKALAGKRACEIYTDPDELNSALMTRI
jgi:tRNA U34 5-methylaminomethyl-2-thiouridine-forming methyltransferase MnmC